MVTLTGTFTRLDGTPATGTVKVTPSRSPIMDPDGKIVISGPQTFPLGVDGTLSVPIPASNDPDLGPPFTYAIDVNLTHASWKISKVWIPHGSTTVDLSEIGDYTPTPGVATRVVTIPADGADGQVLVWDGAGFVWDFPPEGPQGPPGEVTTAALATALAGKVTGTGMEVRVDTSVGTRVLLDHPGGTTMLHGDTGWRDLRPLVIEGSITSVERLAVRRIGNVVYFSCLNLVSTGGGNITPFDPNVADASWIGSTSEHRTILIDLDPTRFHVQAAGRRWRITSSATASRTYSFEVSYLVDTAWPTTLIGTPL